MGLESYFLFLKNSFMMWTVNVKYFQSINTDLYFKKKKDTADSSPVLQHILKLTNLLVTKYLESRVLAHTHTNTDTLIWDKRMNPFDKMDYFLS